jgi:hypothetical protein
MIIGIDFGTTNTRIATWEPEVGGLPALKVPGKSGMWTMPSVVSFRRKPGGGAEIEAIGEDADGLDENTPTRAVIRNIKRWALSSDPFVRRVLENRSSTPWPKYWNAEQRGMQLWGQSIPINEIIMAIINEALKRVGLENISSEVRAACPVHSDYSYRQDMVNIFSKGGFASKLIWVTEEPLLFLALAYSQGRLDEGSYLVYDFGGGSFDCAIATVERQHGAVNLIVYAADGDPLLGGMDIDDKLKTKLKYGGPPNLLRLAKEVVCSNPSGPSPDLPGGTRGTKLSASDVEAVLKEGGFVDRTVDVMMSVYRQAKTIWKRPPNGPALGENLEVDSNGVIKRTIWKLQKNDLASDIDKVLLFGGTTKIPYVVRSLENIFGSQKVVMASQLLPAFQDPELTAVALGAAYPPREQYTPLYVNRLPCRVTLRVRQASGEQKTEYVPFFRLPISKPSAPYVGETLRIDSGSSKSAEYKVTVEDPDGELLTNIGPSGMRMPNFGYASRLRIVIDRFGCIWLDMMSGKEDNPFHDRVELLKIPPWQTSAQRTALERMWEMQREYDRSEHARKLYNLTHNPYGWGVDVG